MHIKHMGIKPYIDIYAAMKEFSLQRNQNTQDELWILEHEPVYTQGIAGKMEHIIQTTTIPIVKTDRGGQVTYHAPGQIIAYTMFDLKRQNINIGQLVTKLETSIINVLNQLNIPGKTQNGAPGVYVNEKKIASIGLRVKNGCTYHGIALNVNMDLKPFLNINPCGKHGLQMTQINDFIENIKLDLVKQILIHHILQEFE